ncbi:hypothetical protein H5410_055809 [Solanum commersonii]|uniref:Uncharacterized protein n=1 Tax=Solanum commersonii TaxID=4109 RepID=A0A9J5WIK0_SOLCO|nr:hypothetical protein H5410_055809 [Solanum commersonii]
MRLLEDSMAEKMLASEIKEGDSVIVDVDSDGNVTVLNGSSARFSCCLAQITTKDLGYEL